MRIKYAFIFFLLFLSHFAIAQDTDLKKLIENLKDADSGGRIQALCLFFDSNVHKRDLKAFDYFLSEGYKIAERDNDKDFTNYLDFYNRLRAIMLITDDDPQIRETKMPKIIEEVLKHYQSVGDEHFIALCNAYIGHYYFIVKEYEKSLEKLLVADEGFKKVGYNRFPDIGKHLHGMALVFYFFRHYDKVAELMEISAQMPPYFQNLHIQRYNTLGAAYSHLKQYEKAADAFLKTKETALVYKDTFWVAYATQNLANTFLERGNYQQALSLYKSNLKSIEQYKRASQREYSQYILGMAKTYVFLNDLPKARKYLEMINYKKISDTSEPMFLFGITYQDINFWINVYDVQHRYHRALKDYKKAYLYADSLYSVKYKIDSLFNGLEVQVAQKRIEAQDKQYENDKKEAIIASKNQQMILIGSLLCVIIFGSVMLFRKNRQINLQNKIINKQVTDLSKTLEQKQVLLSELQHRVKNNLQHVISILEIQKESVDFNNIEELIRGNQNRIHSMALLHKKLNVADNVNDIDLRKYIIELAELVKESYDNQKRKISLNTTCEVSTISIEKALPIGLIITELVSNSMKHAFKRRSIGIINIEISKDEISGQNRLYYSDNGDGFDFNKTSKKGLGQEIIKGLIDQLGGTVTAKSDNGFELTVEF
jgi:two-component sensor histidine kinase